VSFCLKSINKYQYPEEITTNKLHNKYTTNPHRLLC